MIFCSVAALLTLEPVLSLVLSLVLPFIGLLVYLVSKKGIPLYTRLQQAVDAMVRTVLENIAGIRVIKALSKINYEKQRFSTISAEVVKSEKNAGITMALTYPILKQSQKCAKINVKLWHINQNKENNSY